MNDEEIALQFGNALRRQGYQVWVVRSKTGEIKIGAEKNGRKSIIQLEHHNGKGDLNYMGAIARAIDAGKVGKRFLITDETEGDNVHRFTIHLPE